MSTAIQRTLGALFTDGELRLDESATGWEGFRRERVGGAVVYHYVDTAADRAWLRDGVRVGETAVRETIADRLDGERP